MSRSRRLIVAFAPTVLLACGSAYAAATWTASVRNPTDTAGSGTLLLAHTYGATTCTNIPGGAITATNTATASCVGRGLPGATPQTRAFSLQNLGTANGSAVTARLAITGCWVPIIANRITPAQALIGRYNTWFNSGTGPFTSSGSISYDGSAGQSASATQQTLSTPTASASTAYGIAFKTTTTAGGAIFTFSADPVTGTGTADRMVFMNKTGKLAFQAAASQSPTPYSTASFNDGAWHYVVAQLAAQSDGTYTSNLYVDGQKVATSNNPSAPSQYPGYWHTAWSPMSTKSFGTGLSSTTRVQISNFVVWNNSLTDSQVATIVGLRSSATQTDFSNAVTSTNATSHWLLNDTATAKYTALAQNPCTSTLLSVEGGPATALTDLVTAGAQPMPSPGAAGQTKPVSLSTSRAAGFDTFNTAVVLFVSSNVTYSVGAWSARFTWATPTATVTA